MFSLWLMITKEDRELMLHPSQFMTDEISHRLQPGQSVDEREIEAKLKAERIRMGIELQ
jgi:hypothetical protein